MKVEIEAKYPNNSSSNVLEHKARILIRFTPETVAEVQDLETVVEIQNSYHLIPESLGKTIYTKPMSFYLSFHSVENLEKKQ